jgi:hypothetical protein
MINALKNAADLISRLLKDRIAWLRSLRKGDGPQP